MSSSENQEQRTSPQATSIEQRMENLEATNEKMFAMLEQLTATIRGNVTQTNMIPQQGVEGATSSHTQFTNTPISQGQMLEGRMGTAPPPTQFTNIPINQGPTLEGGHSLQGQNNVIQTPLIIPVPEAHGTLNPEPQHLEQVKLMSKMEILEEKMRSLQGVSTYGPTDFASLCLFTDIEIPHKFKIPEFEKYNGSGCPRAHLARYCRKMTAYLDNEKLLMHIFQESLNGSAEQWYSNLDASQVRSWKDMADAFVKHYAFNTFIAPNRLDLQRMEKKISESFKEYAQRWREVAAQVHPPMMEREMASTFVQTLRGIYLDKLLGHVNSSFSDIVIIGENLEDAIKSKKLIDYSTLQNIIDQHQSGPKKLSYPKKKEEEVGMIYAGAVNQPINPSPYLPIYQNPSSYHQRPYPTHPRPPPYQYTPRLQYPPQTTNPPHYINQTMQGYRPRNPYPPIRPYSPRPYVTQNQVYQNTNNRGITQKEYTPLPIPITQLYPLLLADGKIIRVPQRTWNPLPRWYEPTLTCDYHSGEQGHNIEKCPPLRNAIEALIQAGILKFEPNNRAGPSTTNNPYQVMTIQL